MSLYSVGRRTKIWPLCIFFKLVNLAGVNSKLLFNGNQPQNFYKRRKDFLKALSLDLVTDAGQSPETMEEDIPEPLSKARKRCHL
ncbi:hypothetical protein LAZ67_2004923 [Cordylochernes scorpioides]|uniref:Uncharacterized protein n=1 Tax=Cordylochernes scorpioides TaxID=51811 RepID=A0ABY6K4T3_9ARAC|nr:hypothetical protein LAZ67_2004923 [Cordylochernes scorpioides]